MPIRWIVYTLRKLPSNVSNSIDLSVGTCNASLSCKKHRPHESCNEIQFKDTNHKTVQWPNWQLTWVQQNMTLKMVSLNIIIVTQFWMKCQVSFNGSLYSFTINPQLNAMENSLRSRLSLLSYVLSMSGRHFSKFSSILHFFLHLSIQLKLDR